jgi:hypothetical protein
VRPKTTAFLSVAAATAALALPAAASAAPPWSTPRAVPGSAAAAVLGPSLDFGRSSAGVLGWSTSPDPTRGDVPRTGRLAGLGGAVASGGDDLAPYDLAAPVQAYASTRTVALLERNLSRQTNGNVTTTPQRISVAFGGVDGTLGTPHILQSSVSPRIADADLAVNDRGDAVAAWVQARGTSGTGVALNDRVWISTRRAGGSFARPTVLVGSGRITSVDVSVGSGGDLLVAFTRQPIVSGHERGARTVAVRYRRAGHSFGALQTVGPNEGFADIATAIAANGRGYVAYGTQDLGEEANQPFKVYAAVKPAGPSRFRDAVQLDDGAGGLERPVGNVAIAVAPNADATVAWSGVRVQSGPTRPVLFPVLAARTGAGARFGAAQAVAAGNGAVGGVTVAPDGTATVVWTALRPGVVGIPTGVLAARAAAGATAFGPAETVADQPPGANDSPPAVALDPATAQPVVAFTGSGGLLTSERTG